MFMRRFLDCSRYRPDETAFHQWVEYGFVLTKPEQRDMAAIAAATKPGRSRIPFLRTWRQGRSIW
jgi:hypothetical protein